MIGALRMLSFHIKEEQIGKTRKFIINITMSIQTSNERLLIYIKCKYFENTASLEELTTTTT